MHKLPEQIRLDLTKSVNLSNWDLDELISALNKELQARETSSFVSGNVPSAKQHGTGQQQQNRPTLFSVATV